MNENPGQAKEKKIIVDEDWKAQVEAEKQAAKAAAQAQQTSAEKRAKGPLPPPSLSLLASSLGMQAMVAMGLVVGPDGQKLEVDLDEAKHAIDMLDVLWQKTEGNRTAEETAMLDNLLHELRLSYVQVQALGQKIG